jgi:hypothetical protein
MLVFNNYFCKNMHLRDRVAVLNVFLYQTGGSMLHFELEIVLYEL